METSIKIRPPANPQAVGADLEPVMRERLGALFGSQRLAVLSSHRDGQPYSNLVAFVATPDLRGSVSPPPGPPGNSKT